MASLDRHYKRNTRSASQRRVGSLPVVTAGRHCRSSLPVVTAGRHCRSSLPVVTAGHGATAAPVVLVASDRPGRGRCPVGYRDAVGSPGKV